MTPQEPRPERRPETQAHEAASQRRARARTRRYRRLARTGLLLVLVIAIAFVSVSRLTGSGKADATSGSVRAPIRSPQVSSIETTSLGSFGMQAQWVAQENARPGNSDWKIPASASSAIEGFSDHTYIAGGESTQLYVSSKTPFRVDAYRMGYYGGAGARLVWQSGQLPARVQPPCPRTAATNMVACDNWSPSLTVQATSEFVPGDYLLKLVGVDGAQNYVPLTIWDPASHAAYVIKNDVYTWQAWNSFGGYDFYEGTGTCPPNVYPICSRARVLSFDRPYATGQGAGDFLGNEYPLVRFAEQHGLDVSYATDMTLEQHPDFLVSHRALLSLGHDEAWSLPERQAAVQAEAHGVNLAFFAASPILRHVRIESSPLGADRQEVDYRNATEDPLNRQGGDRRNVTGNTWGSPPASWPEDTFVGATYAGFLEPNAAPADFVVADGNAWIFRNTGLHTGSIIPGMVRSDFDEYNANAHPADEQILGHSPIALTNAQSMIGSKHGRVYSDMTYYTDHASGAGVFDSGTNNWIPGLDDCTNCPRDTIAIITGNLLWLFGQGPAAHFMPSHSNAVAVGY